MEAGDWVVEDHHGSYDEENILQDTGEGHDEG